MPTELNLPPALPHSGTIGVIAPASPVTPERLEHGLEALRTLGYRLVLGEHLYERRGHLAGSDDDRLSDLHEMFAREEVQAILCARGGSGSLRLLDRIDYDLVSAHPKVFIGYSDITSLQLGLLARAGLPSFFGPMVQPEFAPGLDEVSLEWLRRLVGEPAPAGMLVDSRLQAETRTLVPGQAEGPCVGGTLSLFAATMGTPYQPDLTGCIFFFEDVYENPARVERYLSQLLSAGVLEQVSGFLVGEARWDASPEEKAGFLQAEEVYQDLLVPLGKPAVLRFPCGHIPNPIALPQGIRARMDADSGSFEVLEPAVAAPAGGAATGPVR